MLFPRLPWQPCLYYNKAQPRSFLRQTSAAVAPSSLFPPRSRGKAGTERREGDTGGGFRLPLTSCASFRERSEHGRPCWWDGDGLASSCDGQQLLQSASPDCVRRGAGVCSGCNRQGESLRWRLVQRFTIPSSIPLLWSPPWSREADVIQKIFWQALSSQQVRSWRQQAWHGSPSVPLCLVSLWAAFLEGEILRMVLKTGRPVRRGFCQCWCLPAEFFGKKIIWVYCSEDLIVLLLDGLYRSIRTLFNVLLPEKLPSQKNTIFFILLIFTAKQKTWLKKGVAFLALKWDSKRLILCL